MTAEVASTVLQSRLSRRAAISLGAVQQRPTSLRWLVLPPAGLPYREAVYRGIRPYIFTSKGWRLFVFDLVRGTRGDPHDPMQVFEAVDTE